MISVKISKKENKICAFDISGHAGFSEYGSDIVCAAVSILVINTINSIDHLTDDNIVLEANDEKKGLIKFNIDISKKMYSNETDILLKSLELGLIGIKEQYGKKYIVIEEVQ